MKDIIVIDNLSKSYGEVKAVSDISFKVKEGELFAFLGVNGAGKSTTISVINGTLKKDSGRVIIDGVDIDSESDKIKRSIGVVFQNSALDRSLTVRENLKHRASLYGIIGKKCQDKIKELSMLLEFSDFIDRPIKKLSGGQKRKADIARALIHSPKILILDEPTTGLDPQTRTTMWKVIENLRKKNNMTVFLTTHYMEETADADYVVILDNGKIVASGSPHDLKERYSRDYLTIYNITEEQAKQLDLPYEKVPSGYRFTLNSTEEATKLIVSHSEIFSDFEVAKGKMDSVFLMVTGKKLDGEDKNAQL